MSEREDVRRLPRDYPPFLYIPCVEHVSEGGQAQAEYRPTQDGRTALLVYSSLDRLRNCCGDDQPWFGLPTASLQLLHDVRPFDVVYTDVYVPQERRQRRRNGAEPMSYVADGGGGGGDYVVDPAALSRVAAGLGAAAGTLDQVGAARPSPGGTGLAEPLLLMILAAASEAAGRLAFESTTLGAAVEDCNVLAETVDSAAASTFLVSGGSAGGERGE